MIVYRKDRRTGAWNVFGPASEVRVGTVTVTKKDGTHRQERVVKVSKPFDVDGVAHVYGYLEDKAPKTCANCGETIRGKAYLVRDSCYTLGYCCKICANEEWFDRSF
jgi:hypothetical protein